jgi:hypothetical protein
MTDQDRRAIDQCLFMVHPPEADRDLERETAIERARIARAAHSRGVVDGLIVVGAIALVILLLI